MKETKGTILKKLFFSTLYISAFTFGGGFVIITFMKRKFVDELHWIDEDEMLDLVAIAQSAPGGHCGEWSHCGGLQACRSDGTSDSSAGDGASAVFNSVGDLSLL